jgi:ABC-type polysaccharide/polyol phosphate transport system ATPase subunit
MSESVVILDRVYKKFARGEHHTSLRDFIPAMARKLWPFGRKAEEAIELRGTEFWAVQDVSFQLKKGESMGIIGPNGSGKSTTLKLLSGILRPDSGSYSVKGRLSALIEVGAGFHPDLTGRENVFLNGRILGMTRKEVRAKFNDIVEFAGVEEFIDTPVKRYSSGMSVRLGFAVAAFVDPEVLLVDEVLAVGDMEFRSRCHARMERMLRRGVTMILVSHNLNEVRNLCQQTLMLFKGRSQMHGPSQKVLERYYQTISEKIKVEQELVAAREGNGHPDTGVRLTGVEFLDESGGAAETFLTGRPMTVRIHYDAARRIEKPWLRVEVAWSGDDFLATVFNSQHDRATLPPLAGQGHVDLRVKSLLMEPNVYVTRVALGDASGVLDSAARLRFVVSEERPVPGVFALEHDWRCVASPTATATQGAVAEGAAA